VFPGAWPMKLCMQGMRASHSAAGCIRCFDLDILFPVWLLAHERVRALSISILEFSLPDDNVGK